MVSSLSEYRHLCSARQVERFEKCGQPHRVWTVSCRVVPEASSLRTRLLSAAGVSYTGDFPVLLPEQLRPIGVGVASLELLCGIKQSALEVSELFDCKSSRTLRLIVPGTQNSFIDAFHLKTSHALGFSHTSSASNDYFSVRSAPQFCPGSTMTSAAPATTSTAVKARGKRAVFSESSTTIPPSTTTGTEAASTPVASLQMSRRASLRGPPPSLLCPQGYMACLQTRGSRARWECASESALTSCGGCPTSSEAEDCTEIVGAESVQCVSKKCQSEWSNRSNSEIS